MKNIALTTEDILKDIPNMKERASMLSTEDFGAYVKSVSNFFTSKLGAISGIFNTNSKRTIGLDKSYSAFVTELTKEKKYIPKIIKEKSYSEVKFIKIPVMVGTKTDIPYTIAKLTEVSDIISNELITTLDELDTFVAKVLADSNFRTATRPFPPLKEKESVTKLADVIESLIDPKSMVDNKTIGELIPNLNSLTDVHNDIVAIAKGSSLKDINALDKQIKLINSRVNELDEYLQLNREVNISKSVIVELGSRLETGAELVTNAVSVIHILNQTATTIRLIIERLK